MRIKPRLQLLDIWQAIARHSFHEGTWAWGESGGLSSVADAERLLCLMYPATEIPGFRLDDPDITEHDVERALRSVGNRAEIPTRIVEALLEFMRVHTGEGGQPTFAGGSSFAAQDQGRSLTEEQRQLGVVDSYARSVTLCLATLGFLRTYESMTNRPEVLARIEELRLMSSRRLTAAMVSLLRSFIVNVYDVGSARGRALCAFLGQGELSERLVQDRFRRRFNALGAIICESLPLSIDVADDLRDGGLLFECGWAWSLVKDAPEVVMGPEVGPQPQGVAAPLPDPYFTVVALDGIRHLFSERTFALGLLDPQQQRLAEALRLRWEITQQYWSGIARFDAGRWPLEEMPWRSTGLGLESEYLSLSVASILVHDLLRRHAADDDLTRTIGVMERLAERGRITGRAMRQDLAVSLHHPGGALPLLGSETLGPPMCWTVTDFSAQLLKRTIQLCALSRDTASQHRLLRLAEQICDHLWARRIRQGEGAGLWDDVRAVYPDLPDRRDEPVSWSLTECVTECMVAACQLYGGPLVRSAELATLAQALIDESIHLAGREELQDTQAVVGEQAQVMKRVEDQLRHARAVVDERPGTAAALALSVLVELDALARARFSAERE
ncbi:SCO2524 family protein [Streptomyces sp. NPDC001663]|uniref:SCO2524 family protein n=1 Tax=Streptomyces sp. NPDC001663 TaxID=3364597 RepID=UPI0036B326CF